jgi:molecular chaperone GrpE
LSEEDEKKFSEEEKQVDDNLNEVTETEPIAEKRDSDIESNDSTLSELKEKLSSSTQDLASCEEKLKRSLADFQNLQKKTNSDIQNGVNAKIDQFMKNFLSIYDDFNRAKKSMIEENVNVAGLESVLKNVNSLLSEYGVTPINALGEIFDPNLHEAVSIVEDPTLDDGTITKEIRKGYISQNRVIRPTIVEISKKSNLDKLKSE